ncbi:MAG: hypothetical protein A3H71_03560 [Candidatus Sungbacteria bacterium RIFCSPLOWO2_02_FULL_48_13b]|uniref:Uncharacterized protein n=1 Tax=Candidatus Sungbacteria bacterium RIFCSPLOWO2_02_FULL_48_13b TaxID=1802283 RepID=A0A1G2LGF7_9BACT|nr:MAG: hypothetical protein A3H71_03560 [Candidatus Sungbacteria bacterium RIFCSPLOWO2_02_FULL_48_13b]
MRIARIFICQREDSFSGNLPTGRQALVRGVRMVSRRIGKNSEGGECKIHAGDFARFPKSYRAAYFT